MSTSGGQNLLEVDPDEDAQTKCNRTLNEIFFTTRTTDAALYCKGVFDGLSCWNDTPAGEVVNQSCPAFFMDAGPDMYAYKRCNEDGTWFRLPETNELWTNYSMCVNVEGMMWQQQITFVHKTGNSISLVALIVSLILLTYFRSIRCARIILHMNLFASFAINNALWLVWYAVIADNTVFVENWIGCQILHVVVHYFLLTNYAWMLCEGLYLHTILVSAFISESRLLFWLHVLGWAVPIIILLPYTIVRVSVPGANKQCWSLDSPYMYILSTPVCVSMILNFLFLCNIVRVLLVKLRAGPHVQTANRPSRTAMQALRATLLLVPLLGLNYLLTPFRPPKNHPLERMYDITSAITASFQGLSVTILFCFCNGEVISQVKRKWKNLMFRPRTNSCTATTVSYVPEKIWLNRTSSRKHLHRNLSIQDHQLEGDENCTDKVNV